jgi:hypothetical protein
MVLLCRRCMVELIFSCVDVVEMSSKCLLHVASSLTLSVHISHIIYAHVLGQRVNSNVIQLLFWLRECDVIWKMRLKRCNLDKKFKQKHKKITNNRYYNVCNLIPLAPVESKIFWTNKLKASICTQRDIAIDKLPIETFKQRVKCVMSISVWNFTQTRCNCVILTKGAIENYYKNQICM